MGSSKGGTDSRDSSPTVTDLTTSQPDDGLDTSARPNDDATSTVTTTTASAADALMVSFKFIFVSLRTQSIISSPPLELSDHK